MSRHVTGDSDCPSAKAGHDARLIWLRLIRATFICNALSSILEILLAFLERMPGVHMQVAGQACEHVLLGQDKHRPCMSVE
jgi:hypothetical protein